LTHSYGGLLEPRGSKLALLKSKFNAENLTDRITTANTRLAVPAVARKKNDADEFRVDPQSDFYIYGRRAATGAGYRRSSRNISRRPQLDYRPNKYKYATF